MAKLPTIFALILALLAPAPSLVLWANGRPIEGKKAYLSAGRAANTVQNDQADVVGSACMVSKRWPGHRPTNKIKTRRSPLGVGRVNGNLRRGIDKTRTEFKETQRALRSLDNKLREIRTNRRRLRDIQRLHRSLP